MTFHCTVCAKFVTNLCKCVRMIIRTCPRFLVTVDWLIVYYPFIRIISIQNQRKRNTCSISIANYLFKNEMNVVEWKCVLFDFICLGSWYIQWFDVLTREKKRKLFISILIFCCWVRRLWQCRHRHTRTHLHTRKEIKR